ncbi:MAG: N-acetyl-gamma-glutamyl-phosphate reductase [Candidatus Contendobacter odensis]|uniref:N-acetyl-gamma-glutamyl-phosphate reductase n=1 Tax=Candidatus Contendibacter odensensis TaxID=1400860 RepID=A0A2G6PF02_9GAMM|nr:MAG: N-acetyl-gamma-glutamyl-phosphate reductase [Candidatus Contendobacter odensis]
MRLFDPDNRTRSTEHKRIFAIYEIAYAINDVLAALLFIIGSILFFNEKTTYAGTWLFLIGSVMFGLRPVIRLLRELKYMRMADYDDVTST